MEGPTIRIVLAPGAHAPSYQTPGAAGADLHAHITQPQTLSPSERTLIPTGVRVEIPNGYEGQVRPRSGWALRHGVTVLNSPGTIDCDYRGEIRVILINLGNAPVQIQPGDRIAQLVIAPFARATFLPVVSLTHTKREEAGFGHSGI